MVVSNTTDTTLNAPTLTAEHAPRRGPHRGLQTSRRGFSLLELMLVLIIIGLVSTVAAVSVGGAMKRAKVRTTKATMDVIKSQIEIYQAEKSQLPADINTLVAQGYLQEGKTKDGWRQDLYYRPNQNNDPTARPFELISLGEDGQPDTPDDINVWTMLEDEDA